MTQTITRPTQGSQPVCWFCKIPIGLNAKTNRGNHHCGTGVCGQTERIDSKGRLQVRYHSTHEPKSILVVRRVDRHTAQITDLDGNPLLATPMMIADAITLLKEATG